MTGVHNECLYQWGRFSFRLADQTSQAMLGTSPLPNQRTSITGIQLYKSLNQVVKFSPFCTNQWVSFCSSRSIVSLHPCKTTEALYLPSQCTMMTSSNGNISVLLAVCAGLIYQFMYKSIGSLQRKGSIPRVTVYKLGLTTFVCESLTSR